MSKIVKEVKNDNKYANELKRKIAIDHSSSAQQKKNSFQKVLGAL